MKIKLGIDKQTSVDAFMRNLCKDTPYSPDSAMATKIAEDVAKLPLRTIDSMNFLFDLKPDNEECLKNECDR